MNFDTEKMILTFESEAARQDYIERLKAGQLTDVELNVTALFIAEIARHEAKAEEE